MNRWQDKYDFSQTQVDSDFAIIKAYFPKCIEVVKSDITDDKQGIDYLVRLEEGGEIFIDVKRREKGASKYWTHSEPELPLEVWSVVEKKKIGWTINGSLKTHYVLYAFDKLDSEKVYMIPFQLLRKVFLENGRIWAGKYGLKTQDSGQWHSQAIFVPASVVLLAISQIMSR